MSSAMKYQFFNALSLPRQQQSMAQTTDVRRLHWTLIFNVISEGVLLQGKIWGTEKDLYFTRFVQSTAVSNVTWGFVEDRET
jgi:hypothetical protein